MVRRIRWFNVVFVLALLLGMLPAAGMRRVLIQRGTQPQVKSPASTSHLADAMMQPAAQSVAPAPASNIDWGDLPLYFVRNQGQIDESVAYYVQGADKALYFSVEGLNYVLTALGEESAQRPAGLAKLTPRRWTVRQTFLDPNPDVRIEGLDKSDAVFSYFTGQPSDWKTDVGAYGGVTYRDLWPGIDLFYRGTGSKLKYEFVVQPGANPDAIRLAYEGAESVTLNAQGQLEIHTPLGNFSDDAPVAWQDIDGERAPVAVTFALSPGGDGSYTFTLGDYDPAYPLVIDPIVLIYCGYIGGDDDDIATSIAVDAEGNAYVAGETESAEDTFPVAVGPDLTYNSIASEQAFVAKVKADGTGLIYAGYIGGDGSTTAFSIAIDSAGNAYVTGETSDAEYENFPVMVGPDLTYNHNGCLGSSHDEAFVAKVNAEGTALLYCGYIGSCGVAYGADIAVDSAGNAYVAGTFLPDSPDTFPVTVGPDLTHNGIYDAFVAKVKADGTGLDYAGYIGGATSEGAMGIAVDAAGNAYVVGSTTSSESQGFPVTVGPDLTYNDTSTHWGDVFVTKVVSDGSRLVYSGYIGGTLEDSGYDIAVDAAGNAYVTGKTESTVQYHAFPATVGPDLTHNGNDDAFVAKVRADGTGLVYAGYIGGPDNDIAVDIAVDAAGNAYMVGSGVAKVRADGTGLVYSTTLIGGNGIAVDGVGNAYVAGLVSLGQQLDFPLLVGPDLTHNGRDEAFVAKLGHGKSVSPAVDVPYHSVVTYTITIQGPLTQTDALVVFTDTLPVEVDFADWVDQPPGATVTDDVVQWSGSLAAEEVLTFTFQAKHIGEYSDVVTNTARWRGAVIGDRQSMALFTVEPPPMLVIYKSVTPVQAMPGDAITYTLRFTNVHATYSASSIVITDTVPLSITNPQFSSSVSASVYPGTQYVWSIGSLNSLASGVITITGVLSQAVQIGDSITNTAYIAGWVDGKMYQGIASAVLDVSGAPPVPPALAISKTAEEYGNTPPLLVGDRILYTIRVTNTTTGTVTGLVVTDTLPAGVSYFGIPKGSPRPDQTGNPVVWSLSSLAAGATQTFNVIVKATGNPTPIGDNTATATCAEDSTPRTATANLDDANVQEALELLKDAVDLNGAPLLVDDVIRYTIVVTNAHASVTMTGVVVTDTLPSGTVFVTSTQPYTEAAGTLWWQVGDIAPGASWTVAVDQRVDGSVNPIAGNVAAVRSDQQDWQETGDVYPPDPVIPTALKLGKTAEEYRNAPPLLENDRILYTIVVTNTSASAISDVVITDTLPAGVSYFGIPKGSPRPVQAGSPVVWELSSLSAGATQTFRVIVKVDGTANPIGENHATATCAEEDLPAGATAQVPGDGVHEPGLVVSGMVNGGGTLRQKREPAAGLEVGDLFTYTLTATNSNTALTLHNLVVTATLPSGAELVSATPTGSVVLPYLRWTQATLGPGAAWQAEVVLRQTGATLGSMELVAASDEQSPVEITITPPGGYWVYLPLILR